jgi:ribonucleoside-diphosphate reductase alpha chain
MAKEGSTISGLMDTLATSVSLALQYGVPLKDVVNKFAHVRFEPSGFTGNPEIPIAKSLVDYIFRWLGSRFLADDDKASLGLIDRSALVADAPIALSGASALAPQSNEGITAQSEAVVAPATPVVAEAPAPSVAEDAPKASALPAATSAAPVSVAKEELTVIATNGNGNGHTNGNGSAKRTLADFTGSLGGSLGGGAKVAFAAQADAPSCAECGSIMIRNGSCYKCLNCGSTSGCS